jgi:hypothetical protein
MFSNQSDTFTQLWTAQIKHARTLQREKDSASTANATARGMRWHPLVIRWALKLYQCSRSAYRTVAGGLALPSERRLQEYRSWSSCDPGMNTDLLLLFQQKLDEDKGDLQSRQVILAFDGMAIRDGISYCRNSGKVSGLEDVGDLVTYTTETLGASLSDLRLAKECMQLMATTLNGKYRVPIGYYLIQKVFVVRFCCTFLLYDLRCTARETEKNAHPTT